MSDTSETAATPEPSPEGEAAEASSITSPSGTDAGGSSDPVAGGEVAYHLHLDSEEARFTASALRLLIGDEAHEPTIRGLARDALVKVGAKPEQSGIVVVPLLAGEMKILHTSVKLLLDDLRRDQADEQRVLRGVLKKLPDEHAIRAIAIE